MPQSLHTLTVLQFQTSTVEVAFPTGQSYQQHALICRLVVVSCCTHCQWINTVLAPFPLLRLHIDIKTTKGYPFTVLKTSKTQ